jgi:hypothetical protein
LLNGEKRSWEALIVELRSPNYAKVGAKMMEFEGREVEVLSATSRAPRYKYLEAMKLLSILKYIFNNPP